MPAHPSGKLARVELVARHEEEKPHAQAAYERKAVQRLDQPQAVGPHDGARKDEEHHLGHGPAGNEARQKRAPKDECHNDREHAEVLNQGDSKLDGTSGAGRRPPCPL